MIKRAIKRTAAALFPRSGRHSVILAYHSIGGGSPFSQPVQAFEEQMQILAARFTVVPVPTLLDAVRTGGERMAAITFDDGFEDLYTCAFPILRKLRFPFTAFLTTGFVESGRGFFDWSPHYAGLAPITWEQAREMAASGCSVGSHTHSHPRLSDCSIDELLAELTQSKRILEAHTGTAVNMLAYPFGQPHDYDRRVTAAAAVAGYTSAFTGLQTCLTSLGDSFGIPRVMIDATDGRADFIEKIGGQRNFVAPVERLYSALIRLGLRRQPVAAPRSTARACL